MAIAPARHFIIPGYLEPERQLQMGIDGTGTVPAYSFESEQTLGFYRPSGGKIACTGAFTITGNVVVGTGATFQLGIATISPSGGGSAIAFGTTGGSGPATAAQNGWLSMLDSTGATVFVPCWK
jgi:hypothetical protein